MREVPLDAEFRGAGVRRATCFEGQFDMLILLTGVGTRLLNQVIETRWPAGAFAEALRADYGGRARSQADGGDAGMGRSGGGRWCPSRIPGARFWPRPKAGRRSALRCRSTGALARN